MRTCNKQLRAFFIIIAVTAMFCLCAVRLVNLQIINGENLRKVSEDKLFLSMKIEAPRGDILDRYGNVLATNRMGYSVVVEKGELSQIEIVASLNTLLNVAGDMLEITDPLPISNTQPFEFVFIGDTDEDKKEAEIKWKKEYKIDEDFDAARTVERLCEIYNIDLKVDTERKRRLAGIVYDMKRRGFSIYNPYVVSEDVSAEVVAKVKENSLKLSGITVKEKPVREYPGGTLASHILGNVGVIYQEEYEALKDNNYSMDAMIGKQGIELTCEQYLKGDDGLQGFEQTVQGLTDVIISSPAKHGNNVFLTLDKSLQEIMEKSLEGTIKQISQSVSDCNAGSAVCIDVNNGDILAMASYPTYVPSEYNKKYNELIKNPGNPVWNRAIGGAYEPGSTFKMVTAIAATEEGIIKPDELILDEGKYKYYKDYQPECMEWKHGKTHGYVDVVTALQESCNYYFFDVGRRLGIDKLVEYEKKFGLGQKTGIEIGGEVSGTIASPKSKEKRGENWNPGDTLQASIGQSDNLFTPIQLAHYVSTIANGGTRYKPHLIKSVKDYNDGSVIKENKPVITGKIDIDSDNLTAVQKGMEKVAQEGTASSVFEDFFIDIAGKTGTAEVSRGSNNGIFVAYAPAKNPQIAIAIVIEHGTGGYLAAPIAKAVFEEYFTDKEIVDLYTLNTLNR